MSADQFVLKSDNEGGYSIRQAPTLIDRSERQACYKIDSEVRQLKLKVPFFEAMNARVKVDRATHLTFKISDPPDSLVSGGWQHEGDLISYGGHDLLVGLPLHVDITRAMGGSGDQDAAFAQMDGQLLLTSTFDRESNENDLGLEIFLQRAALKKPFEVDLTDILPLAVRGRVIPISPIDLPVSDRNSSFKLLGFDLASGIVRIEIERVVYREGCAGS